MMALRGDRSRDEPDIGADRFAGDTRRQEEGIMKIGCGRNNNHAIACLACFGLFRQLADPAA
jgi:hypothetical protein